MILTYTVVVDHVNVETAANGTGSQVSSQTVTSGNSITVYAITRDASNNFITNAPATWSLISKTGFVADGDLVPSGDSKNAVFTAHSGGTAQIQAVYGSVSVNPSGTITVPSSGVTGIWTNNVDGNWTAVANWSSNPSYPHSAGDAAWFGVGTALRTVTLDANVSVATINFTNANSFVISGANTLTLDKSGNGAAIQVTAGTANAIQTPVSLNDNVTITPSSGTIVTLSGIISNAPSVAKTMTIGGAGKVALTYANTYGPASSGTVGTTLSGGGTLQLGNNNALGAGDLSISASGTIQAGGSVSITNNIALGSSVTATVDANSSSLNLSGTISGSSAIVNKNTAGTLTLSGTNTYSGGTTLSAGQLNINYGGSSSANSAIGTGALTISGGTLDNTSSGDVTLAPNNAQNWNGDFTYAGSANNLNLGSGAVTLGASRQVTVSANTLTVGGIISGSSYGLTKAGGGTLALSGANTFSGTTVISGGTLTLSNSLALQNSTLNYNNQGGTLSFGSLTSAFIAGLTGSQNLNYGSVNLNLGTNNTTSTYSGLLSGSGQLQKSGTSTLTLGNPGYTGNTIVYSGGLNITGGTLTSHLDLSAQLGVVNAVISGGTVTSASGLYITSPTGGSGTIYGNAASLTITNGAQVTANADGNGRAISYGSANNARPGGNGSLTVGTTGDTATLVTANGVLDMFFSAGGGTVGNFTVNLNGGTLAVNRIQETTYSANQSGTFKFNGGVLKALASDTTALFIPATPSQFTTPIYAGGAIIDANGYNISIGSVLTHGGGTPDGGLTKQGSGTLTLTNANSYTGLTTINAGTLNINSEYALGGANYGGLTFNGGTLQYAATLLNSTTDVSTKPVSFVGNATIDVNGNTISFANPIGNSGSGALTVASTAANGVFVLQGANTYSGGTTVSSGTLKVNNATGSGTGSGSVSVASGAKLGGSGIISGTVTFASGALAILDNSGPLTISGALAASANVVHLNLTNNVPPGTYLLASYNSTGSSGAFAATPVIDSGSLLAGGTASITTVAGQVNLIVPPSSSTNVLISSGNPSGYTSNVVFTATLTGLGTPIGTVQFRTNGVNFGSPVGLTAGVVSTNLASLPRGTNLIVAEYSGDTFNSPSTNALLQVVTNHPPVAQAIALGAQSATPVTLTIVGGKFSPTDADGDALSISAVQNPSTQSGVVTTDGTNVTYTAANSFSGTDTFTYSVSDGYGGTNTQTVTVTVAANGAGNNLINGPVNNGDGTYTISYAGIPNYKYALETAPSLALPITWTPVITNTASATSGQVGFTFDTSAGEGYFRTRYVP